MSNSKNPFNISNNKPAGNFPSPEGSNFQSATMSHDRSKNDTRHTKHESKIDTGYP